jgi:hypothetical protein
MSQLNQVYVALGYGLDDRAFEFREGLGIYTTASRPALGPTLPPIHWVPGAISLGVNRLGLEADHSPLSSSKLKNAWSHTPTTPIRLQGVILSYKKHREKFTFTFI